MMLAKEYQDPTVRVFIVGGSRLFNETLARALRTHGGLAVVGSAIDPNGLAEQVRASGARLVLLDASGETDPAEEWTRVVKEALPAVGVLAVGVPDRKEVILRFLEAGAGAFVTREGSLTDALGTVEGWARGRWACAPHVTAAVLHRIRELARARPPAAPESLLSDREKQILELVAAGYLNKKIALTLGITVCTVKNHIHNILSKLGSPHRRDAARYARRDPEWARTPPVLDPS